MQLEQSFEVARPIDTVWQIFKDLRATASCIPGAELTEIKDDSHATGIFRVQLGPIKAAFEGQIEVTRDDANHSGVIAGSGRDGKNSTRVKSTVTYRLSALDAQKTKVDMSVDYSISGPLAQFSRGAIVQDIAASITKMFVKNLENMLSATAAGDSAQAETAPPAPDNTVQSINLFSLIMSVLWRKIAGIFGAKN